MRPSGSGTTSWDSPACSDGCIPCASPVRRVERLSRWAGRHHPVVGSASHLDHSSLPGKAGGGMTSRRMPSARSTASTLSKRTVGFPRSNSTRKRRPTPAAAANWSCRSPRARRAWRTTAPDLFDRHTRCSRSGISPESFRRIAMMFPIGNMTIADMGALLIPDWTAPESRLDGTSPRRPYGAGHQRRGGRAGLARRNAKPIRHHSRPGQLLGRSSLRLRLGWSLKHRTLLRRYAGCRVTLTASNAPGRRRTASSRRAPRGGVIASCGVYEHTSAGSFHATVSHSRGS